MASDCLHEMFIYDELDFLGEVGMMEHMRGVCSEQFQESILEELEFIDDTSLSVDMQHIYEALRPFFESPLPELCTAEGVLTANTRHEVPPPEMETITLLHRDRESGAEHPSSSTEGEKRGGVSVSGGRLRILRGLTNEQSLLRNNQLSGSLSAASIGAIVAQIMELLARLVPSLSPSVLFLAVCAAVSGFVTMVCAKRLAGADAENLELSSEQREKSRKQWRRLGAMMASLGIGALVPEFFGPLMTSMFSGLGISTAFIAGAIYRYIVLPLTRTLGSKFDRIGSAFTKVGSFFTGSKNKEPELKPEEPPVLKILFESKGDGKVAVSEEPPSPPASDPEKKPPSR